MDHRQFRSTLGSFVTGVTVLTAVEADGRRWGMTANSLASVSLEPALISVCVARRAGSFRVFDACSSFGVSILAHDQQDLAVRFATPIDDKFADLALRRSARSGQAPTLDGSTGWLECLVHRRVDAGDHIMLIGEVVDCGISGKPALGYCQGSFFDLAPMYDGGVRRERTVSTGWLAEVDGKLVLRRVEDGERTYWTVPTSPMPSAATTADSLVAGGHAALSTPVTVSFLHSILDDPVEDATCFVYRARFAAPFTGRPDLVAFPLDELPWGRISTHVVTLLERYVAERRTDQFGIYLSVGAGRIAAIESDRDWAAAAGNGAS